MHCALHRRANTAMTATVHPLLCFIFGPYLQPAAAGHGYEDQHCSSRKGM